MDIYKFNDYRKVLESWINTQPIRGIKSHLAEAAGCSPSWMTRVLTGSVQLTPDQAMGLALYMNLNEEESDYFLLLVDLERAASKNLKKRLEKKIAALLKNSGKVGSSIKIDSQVSIENSAKYYSSWIYAATHVACMIRPLRVDQISLQLKLPDKLISNTVKELKEMGLLTSSEGKWTATSANIHLPQNENAKLPHSVWRQRTIQFFYEGHDEGLHYSAVHCLSMKDLEKIQRLLKDTVLNCREIIKESPSEQLAVFCLDWYQLK